jgi:hypothetical protein
MLAFLSGLSMAAQFIPALAPLLGKYGPDLTLIGKVAELASKAAQDAIPNAALVVQVLGGKPLSDAQRAELQATYDRLYANVQRPAKPPPGSV